jgi:N-carbamoylputrescine amidase
MRVALVQHACSADLKQNRQYTEQGIVSAAQQGAELVLLQELHGSLYFCQTEDVNQFDLAKPIPSEETDWLSNLAKQLKIVIVSSLFEKRAAGLYHNTSVVFEKNGEIAGKYRKMHIPDDPNFYEKFYFTIGDLGFQPIQTSVGKLGVLVCWDQWYPEAARLMALAGAEILLYPTAIGWNPDDDQAEKDRQKDAWITIQRSHAIANGIPVLSCNRCGLETDPSGQTKGIHFWGNSFIVGSQGEFLAQASIENPQILMADLDMKRSEDVRRIWPFLRDRRIDYYHDLTKRYLD